jgi:hypothetical protein
MLIESVVCYKWKPIRGYRSEFRSETVNVLRAMVRRNYPRQIRFICVTDDPSGIDSDIETVPIWDDYANLPPPQGGKNPSCYRRLRAFSAGIESVFGRRFVSLDLDCVIVNDLRPLWDRHEDIVLWGDTNPRTHYNGSMLLMTAGARTKVWDRFNPAQSPQQARQAGQFGSDQAWIGHCLGPHEARWTAKDGVYSYRNHIKPNGGRLPADARVVLFHGAHDPWCEPASRLDWVRQHWRQEQPA